MERKNYITIAAILIFVFVLGGGIGIFYASQKYGPRTAENDAKYKAVQLLSSKVVPSITAYGQISEINGRNLTLSFGGDNITVKIRDDALVYLPATTKKDDSGKSVTSPQKTAKFSDIKKDDNVSINLKLLSDGKIEGQMVVILNSGK